MVGSIHAVSFAAHPERVAWREGLRRRVITRRSAERAVRVLTVSEFSKREIVRHFHIDPAKVDVIYHGLTSQPHAAAVDPRSPLALYVGSIFSRRHVPELIQGFAALARRRPEVRLAIVGDNRTTPHLDLEAAIETSGSREQISYRAYVSDSELFDLYARATAFVFLSDYEGFGMTPLEALAAGVPIVVLDTEVAREISGPAAVSVERPDPLLVERALERVLFDDGERERLRDAARSVLERYSWRECAQRTLQVLLSCARNPDRGPWSQQP
jgi:glycosyltransferase involved in cell wall biosynthesis